MESNSGSKGSDLESGIAEIVSGVDVYGITHLTIRCTGAVGSRLSEINVIGRGPVNVGVLSQGHSVGTAAKCDG